MILLTASNSFDSIVQFITVILIFLFVLGLTYFSTVFIARVQGQSQTGSNIKTIETYKLSPNKFIQIVKIGEKYYSLVVCKDTVTVLGELSKEDITVRESETGMPVSFKEILDKAKNSIHKK